MSPSYRQSLMIGTTGMLSDAAEWIAVRSERSLLVSRTASRSPLAKLRGVQTLDHNWTRTESFARDVMSALREPPTLALLWIHQSGQDTLRSVVAELAKNRCLIAVVRGSQMRNAPTKMPTYERRDRARLIYIVLGAIQSPEGARWLTWDEISAGTIYAIERHQSRIVGTIP